MSINSILKNLRIYCVDIIRYIDEREFGCDVIRDRVNVEEWAGYSWVDNVVADLFVGCVSIIIVYSFYL